MKGKRIKVEENGIVRYGTIVEALSKEETAMCSMFGQLVKAKMDDTGELEEFTYGYEQVD